MTITGKVQGVFFRSNARKKALELKIRGYAKNLENGQVEIVAQGNDDKLKDFVKFLKSGPGYANVYDMRIKHKDLEYIRDFKII